MLDIRQTANYARYLKSEGWTVERIEGINYFIRKLPLFGSVMKVQRPERIDFEVIDRLARKHHVFQIIIEPDLGSGIRTFEKDHKIMLSHGFKLSKGPFLPSKTLQIDLTQSQKAIFSRFKKDARQAIKRGSGVFIKSYSTPSELKIFREKWKNSVNYKRYVPSEASLVNLRKAFDPQKSLFLASHNINSRIIGGVIFTISSHERSNYISYYWQAFTNKEGRSSLSQYSLLWNGILWAKKQGCKLFDFEGIYDPRFPNRSWLGFTHFKRSFGGSEVDFPGCYTKFRFPL